MKFGIPTRSSWVTSATRVTPIAAIRGLTPRIVSEGGIVLTTPNEACFGEYLSRQTLVGACGTAFVTAAFITLCFKLGGWNGFAVMGGTARLDRTTLIGEATNLEASKKPI